MESASHKAFWTEYQPGFWFTDAPRGTPAFYAPIEDYRYALEPAISEKARFAEWKGQDVLEAGCGIATDGINLARRGANYTGVDFSDSAARLSRRWFELEAVIGRIVQASITDLRVADQSKDLVYGNGVIHHVPDMQRTIDEMFRVLRPGGKAIVMVYHRGSLNYYVNIMLVRRALTLALVVPGVSALLARLTHEERGVLNGHRDLLRERGLRYVRDRELVLNSNPDGPGNPLSKVTTPEEARSIFGRFENVETDPRFLLRLSPGGQRLAATRLAKRLERQYGLAPLDRSNPSNSLHHTSGLLTASYAICA